MISCTSNSKFYSHVIHNFMEIENFNNENIIQSFLKSYTNPMLVKEQFDKCIKTVHDLFYWTKDNKSHEMTAFHEVILYDFLRYMSDLQDELENFNRIYFDQNSLDMIDEFVKEDQMELPEESLDSLKEFYFDIYGYVDCIFADMDFLDIEIFFNEHTFGDETLINRLGINLDYYFEILPKDIREKYKTGHCTLSGEISSLINFIQDEIEHRDLYKLFWNKTNFLELKQIVNILNYIFLFYFQNLEIDICWDIVENKDSIDVIFYKKRDKNIKVIVEFIDIKKAELKQEIIDDLFNISDKFDNAFFVFFVSNNDEYENAFEFISKYIYTQNTQLYLNVMIFDSKKRKAVSKKTS